MFRNVQYAVNKYAEFGQSKQTKQKVPDFGIPPSVYARSGEVYHIASHPSLKLNWNSLELVIRVRQKVAPKCDIEVKK